MEKIIIFSFGCFLFDFDLVIDFKKIFFGAVIWNCSECPNIHFNIGFLFLNIDGDLKTNF